MEKFELGIIAGSFDVIHRGYIDLFADAKRRCEKVAIALNKNPHGKTTVFPVKDRVWVLRGMKDIDFVMAYDTIQGLVAIFELYPDALRIVGSDYEGELPDLGISNPVYYHQRNHDWSATKYKQMIADSIKGT